MSDAALAGGLLVLALASALGALRCLADRLLASAAIYTVLGAALAAAAGKAALDAL
ncbi:MAG: hypothetical protein QOH13_851 [Thermoleophilaceae bacterium]|jgi:hypothetical protein|nr:hypothetical protein [Thermoleophilaceae bacterium]